LANKIIARKLPTTSNKLKKKKKKKKKKAQGGINLAFSLESAQLYTSPEADSPQNI
jgi:hypothetical protein